ncbi:MAG: hypothetical protein Kow0031_13970 [Anaerolineae bacterium]
MVASNTVVKLTNLIVIHGYNKRGTGGGIDNQGIMTLTNVQVTENHVGAQSLVPGSTIAGGGIANSGQMALVNSAVFNNRAGANLRAQGVGGGVANAPGATLTMTNSTISGNYAGNEGGGLWNAGTATLTHVTVTKNERLTAAGPGSGAGIYVQSGTVSLANSLIADQTQTVDFTEPGSDCAVGGGSIVSNDYNLDSDNTCNLTNTNDVPNSSNANLAASLNTNGGNTPNLALLAGSAALDQIPVVGGSCNGTGITTDQRGEPRPGGSNCDIGAFELEPSGGTIVIKKSTSPDSGSGFIFSQTIDASGNFNLDNTGSVTFSNALAGNYTVTEEDPTATGYSLKNITCDDADSTGNVISRTATINLQTGETVTCTFFNSKLASLTVVKNTLGGDATFPFTSTTLINFNVTTVNGTGQHSFAGLQPGTYDLRERVPAGWSQTAASCSDGSNPASIDLAAGENVICTFANAKLDTIIVEKRTIGGDSAFSFTGDLGAFSLTTSSGAASRSFTGLSSGNYSISETVPAGWIQTGATCDNGDTPGNINLGSGVTVRCTFTNTKLSQIRLVKRTVGGDDSFPFTSTLPSAANFNLTTAGGLAQRVFSNLAPGSYSISESVPAGWELTAASCTNRDAPDAINLGPGQDITCTFHNTRPGSLTVVKNTLGGDGAFLFTSTTLISPTFSLTTVGGTAQQRFDSLQPGTYDLSETVPSGWNQTSVVCSDGSDSGAIDIAAGENVTCTFENTKQDTIVVIKQAIGGDDTFPFTSTIPGNASFNLITTNSGASQSFTGLTPGTYSIGESLPGGWTAAEPDPLCSNGDNASNITLGAGQTVACVFISLKEDTIVVEKRSLGGDATFAFTSTIPSNAAFNLTTSGGVASTSFTNLPPATYAVSETSLAGWGMTGAACDNGASPDSIGLGPGQTATCTFTNTKLGSLTVVKQTSNGDDTFPFSSTIPGNATFDLTTSNNVAQQTFADLLPGTYAVSETAPAGWSQAAAACSDGSDPASINLGPGENVTCTFENSRLGSLTVVQNSSGGDDTFPFSSNSLSPASFNLTTSGGTAQQLFANLSPGTYDVTESIPAGWSQVAVTCSDGSSPTSINIGSGENVTCTFENAKLGSLTVVKNSGGDDVFHFSSNSLSPASFNLNTSGGTAQQLFASLLPGTYDVSEIVPAGGSQSAATCTDGSNPASINIGPGENVTCTFSQPLLGSVGGQSRYLDSGPATWLSPLLVGFLFLVASFIFGGGYWAYTRRSRERINRRKNAT